MFLDLKKLCKKHNINFFNNNTFTLIILNAIRNIGKTTTTLNTLMELTNENNKIVFMRNTQEQLKNFIPDFNNRYMNKYNIISQNIYKMEKQIKYNKKLDIEEEIYVKGEHLGYVCDINNYQNYKSLEAKNIRWIVFDEYNQIDNVNMFFEKFINLLKTFERYNKISMILLGNRDTPNNELMVRLELIPQHDIYDSNKDYINEFIPNCYFIEMGNEQFKDLKNENTLSNALASMDITMKEYLEGGGYLKDNTNIVLPFKKRIYDTLNCRYILTFDNREVVVCIWGENEDKLGLIVNPIAIKIANEEKLAKFAINGSGNLVTNSYFNNEATIKIIKSLVWEYKNNNMYFDSFEIKELFEKKFCLLGVKNGRK